MVNKNSPVFMACILLAFGVIILLSSNASASDSYHMSGDMYVWDGAVSKDVSFVITDGDISQSHSVLLDTPIPPALNTWNVFGYMDMNSNIQVEEWGFYASSNFARSISIYGCNTTPTANDYVLLDTVLCDSVGWHNGTIEVGGSYQYYSFINNVGAASHQISEINIFSSPVDSVSWNQSSYSVGDTGSISYHIAGYDSSTYDYSIDIFEDSTFKSYCHLSSNDSTASYKFSCIVEPVTYYAKLTKRVKGSSIPLVITTDNCTVGPSNVSIVFNQSIYGPDDLVSISYHNCPNGSKIILQDDVIPHQVSNTWVDISGNGSVSYKLSNADANRVFYAKVYSVSDIVLASDYMQIDDISSGYCQVHGGIYDSQDYHPLIGTVFIGDSYSDVVGYGDYGAYSIIVPWGTYDISAVVSSYLTYNISDVVISGTDYDLNMFLSVNDTTTHVFRGSVTDTDTNAAVDNVLIQVCNDTFDEYDFTSQSGVWVVNGLTSGANYTLHATKDGYHPYTYSFMYDPGDFYHNFMMSSVVVEDDVIEDVLEDDESMTEYFDNKFRGFAPSAWGIFILSIILWLMAILTSFGGSGKRR